MLHKSFSITVPLQSSLSPVQRYDKHLGGNDRSCHDSNVDLELIMDNLVRGWVSFFLRLGGLRL